MATFKIGSRTIGEDHPTWFIADISANHDGDLERAKALIRLAAEAGADAAKFQNFRAEGIVSDRGFRSLGSQQSHQAKWKSSVFEVYKKASLPWEWTAELKAECDKAGIVFFSAPYDLAAIDMLDPFIPLYKVGSGDITWLESIRAMASKGKPVLLAAGASTIGEVQAAMDVLSESGVPIGLMQCNTNYTASLENFRHIHLRVLQTFGLMYPNAVLGLSDHTPGHSTVLGAVAYGARLIEKHFTDDNGREGPDHPFSMNPRSWREMVDRTRELELALGSTQKFVAANERETVVLQRRCLRAKIDLPVGTVIRPEHVEALRPAPADGLEPAQLKNLVGKLVRVALARGQHFSFDHVGSV
jgi:N-acetylneuraminate synthase